jgi:DNA-binding transcriptional ArsR family regulator
VLVLKRLRGHADAVLHVTGRDIEDATVALTFAADIGSWQMSETPADEILLGETRAAILRYVRGHEGAKPKEIAEGTGLEDATVRQTARRMADDGQIDTDGHGRYMAVTAVTAVTFLGQDNRSGVTALSLPSPDKGRDEAANR